MNRRLLILGAGGHGKVVADAARASGRYSQIAFADDRFDSPGRWMDLEVVGPIDKVVAGGNFDGLIVAIGSNMTRLALQRRLEGEGATFDVVIHPRAVPAASAAIGPGTVVMANSVVNADARLGRAVIANTGCIVEHDCTIGDGTHLSPGSLLAGGCNVGECCWVGMGACLLQGTAVGVESIIGAGAVVRGEVGTREMWAGVPARRIRAL